MKIDKASGRLSGVRFVESPNCDDRPSGTEIDALIIHAISLPPGEYGERYIEEFFCNRLNIDAHPYFAEIHGLTVSAHFLVCRDGEIIQFVPVTKRAWHAGESLCLGRTRVNDFSIGIELEGCDDASFADVQYEKLCELTRALLEVYPGLHHSRWFGHSDIAPGRKSDPGPCFDWVRYRELRG